MPAWMQGNNWNGSYYKAYRDYVETTAPSLNGEEEDCADLSLRLLVDFAEEHALCA
jgi:hypothetical protein